MVRIPATPYCEMPVAMDGRETTPLRVPFDVVRPKSIKHFVEEAVDLENHCLSYRYNFIVYEFETANGTVSARTYLDTANEVAIYIPKTMTMDDEAVGRVVHYLLRRYHQVKSLGAGGYEPLEIECQNFWQDRPVSDLDAERELS